MKAAILLSLFAWMTVSVQAQSYRVMADTGYHLFDNGEMLRAIRVDSTAIDDGDQVQFLPRMVRNRPGYPDAFPCFTIDGASWMGSKIRVGSDGHQILYNRYGTPIHLEMQRSLNDPWMVYEGGDMRVRGVIYDVVSEYVLGEPDSVRYIGFQALDADSNEIEAFINQKTIAISKHNGITRTVNFISFPEGFEQYYSAGFGEYDLVGREGSEYGVRNLTRTDVFDFQPGDELHISESDLEYGHTKRHYILHYLDRQTVGDSIHYVVIESYDQFVIGPSSWEYDTSSVDTVDFWVTSDPLFDQWSQLPFVVEWENMAYTNYYTQLSESPDTKVIYDETTNLQQSLPNVDPECWVGPVLDDFCVGTTAQKYIRGQGGPYFECESGFGTEYYFRKLVYTSLNGEEWGTPFELVTATTEVRRTDDPRIHPNPAKDRVRVELDPDLTPATFTLWDLRGRRVKSVEITSPHTDINLDALPPGPYFHSIKDRRGRRTTGKLMIQ